MLLKQWLSDERGARAALAREARTTYVTIAKALRGEPIDRKVAERISAATGNAVTLAELVLPPADEDPSLPSRPSSAA